MQREFTWSYVDVHRCASTDVDIHRRRSTSNVWRRWSGVAQYWKGLRRCRDLSNRASAQSQGGPSPVPGSVRNFHVRPGEPPGSGAGIRPEFPRQAGGTPDPSGISTSGRGKPQIRPEFPRQDRGTPDPRGRVGKGFPPPSISLSHTRQVADLLISLATDDNFIGDG